MRNTDRQHHLADLEGFTIFKLEKESAWQPVNLDDELVLELRHHALPEGETICGESIEVHRYARVGILDASLRAKLSESKSALRIVDVGGKAVRFKHHALWHVCQPTIHRPTENAERNTTLSEMRGNGKSIGTSPNDRSF